MKMAKLTFLASFVLVLAPGLGAQDVEAEETVPLEDRVCVGPECVLCKGQVRVGGMHKGPREKQVADLHKKRRDLRDQLGKALQKDDRKKAKKAEAKLQSVERQLSQLARIERGSRQAGPYIRPIIANPNYSSVSGPHRCNCVGIGETCSYCELDNNEGKVSDPVRNRPYPPPVLLTRPQQGRSELAPGSGGEFDGKKPICLTCGKRHGIFGGKSPSVGDDDLPNSPNVRPADLVGRPRPIKDHFCPCKGCRGTGRGTIPGDHPSVGPAAKPVGREVSSQTPRGTQRPSRVSGLFSRSGRSGLSTREIKRPAPVRRPKSSSRPVPVRRPETSSRPSPSRRPTTRASQGLKSVRKPR